jgi:hypothetical protein
VSVDECRASVRDDCSADRDESEVEIRPGAPPVIAAGDDRARAGHFHVLAVPVLDEPVRRRELDLDLAWAARVERCAR